LPGPGFWSMMRGDDPRPLPLARRRQRDRLRPRSPLPA
jgi:hypothetical protein